MADAAKTVDSVQAAGAAAGEKSSETLNALNDVVQTVKEGRADDFFCDFCKNHAEDFVRFGKVLLLAVIVLALAWLFARLTRKLIDRTQNKLPHIDGSAGHLVYVVARTFIWLFAFLIILDLFGINTASILTVLGAVGLAVALAMKDSMSNVAAGVMLIILRPYKTGDFVDCGAVAGTIQTMGLFSTEVATIDGIFVAVPNSVIFGAPIKNYSRNNTRRADITVGIDYSNSLPEGIKVLEKLMRENELILQDPAPQVLVADLADSSVNLTLRFWCDNAVYWDAYWQVKAAIKPALEGAGLSIPFPQRVITFANSISGERKAE